MDNTIIITEGTKTFTIKSDREFEENINGEARTIRVFSPRNFDISGAIQSNQKHFVIGFTNADVDINGVSHHGNVTVTNHPGEFVEVCIN